MIIVYILNLSQQTLDFLMILSPILQRPKQHLGGLCRQTLLSVFFVSITHCR